MMPRLDTSRAESKERGAGAGIAGWVRTLGSSVVALADVCDVTTSATPSMQAETDCQRTDWLRNKSRMRASESTGEISRLRSVSVLPLLRYVKGSIGPPSTSRPLARVSVRSDVLHP